MLGFMSLHHESTFDFTSVNFAFFKKKQTNKTILSLVLFK